MTNPKFADRRQNRAIQQSPSRTAVAWDGAKALDDISAFIRRYLACGDHQLTVLTLWSTCCYCYGHFFTAPYLHARSPQPQCGKSLCLTCSRIFPPAEGHRLCHGRRLARMVRIARIPHQLLHHDSP